MKHALCLLLVLAVTVGCDGPSMNGSQPPQGPELGDDGGCKIEVSYDGSLLVPLYVELCPVEWWPDWQWSTTRAWPVFPETIFFEPITPGEYIAQAYFDLDDSGTLTAWDVSDISGPFWIGVKDAPYWAKVYLELMD